MTDRSLPLPSPVIRRRLQWLAYYYPLTPAGTVLAAAGLALIGRGLALANPYALFLALLALTVLALLALAGRLQARRSSRHPLQWEASAPLAARRPAMSQWIHGEEVRLLPFFRLHFSLSGRLMVGRRAYVRVSRQLSFASSGAHPLPLYLPLSGVLSATGRFAVRDLFGLTRSRFGEDLVRTLTVLPGWHAPEVDSQVEPAGGFEEKSIRRSSEEEKYFMREYQPGDRLRDINWKVSSRLQELITRISPVTQEKTRLLSVAFRNYRSDGGESLESVLHLDYLKSWLLAFLRSLKRSNDKLQFSVRTASTLDLLATEEDIERFAGELAGLFYQHDPGPAGSAVGAEPPGGELFVFSTPFDRGLAQFLSARPQTRMHLFRTATARARQPEQKPEHDPEPDAERTLFTPGVPLHDAFLPGLWAFRRQRALKAPPLGSAIDAEEQSFSVRIFP
jgi:uncharacterized protein (DUF58 family)